MVLFLALCSKTVSSTKVWMAAAELTDGGGGGAYCQSWRLAVEANNVRAWRTVPTQCLRHIETYMTGGQYERDLNFTVDAIFSFVDNEVSLSHDGLDAWILDVDDTCISNLIYYKRKRFGYLSHNNSILLIRYIFVFYFYFPLTRKSQPLFASVN